MENTAALPRRELVDYVKDVAREKGIDEEEVLRPFKRPGVPNTAIITISVP